MQWKTTPHRRKDPHDGRGLSNALQTRRFGVWFLLGNKKESGIKRRMDESECKV